MGDQLRLDGEHGREDRDAVDGQLDGVAVGVLDHLVQLVRDSGGGAHCGVDCGDEVGVVGHGKAFRQKIGFYYRLCFSREKPITRDGL